MSHSRDNYLMALSQWKHVAEIKKKQLKPQLDITDVVIRHDGLAWVSYGPNVTVQEILLRKS